MGGVNDLNLLLDVVKYLQHIFLGSGMQTYSRFINQQHLVLLAFIHGGGFQFQEEGKEPSDTTAALFGIEPFLFILDPEFDERFSAFFGIGMVVMRQLKIDLDLVVFPHILSPEILKIQGKFTIQVLNLLFQYSA